MRHISKSAIAQGCPYVICIGDLVHEKQGVGVEQLSMLYDELQWSKNKGVLWIWVRGNHEVGIKSLPHMTPMHFFQEVCWCIIKPQVISLMGCEIAFLPWYRAEEFRSAAKLLAKEMRGRAGTRILMAHVGLDEGKPSASNMYVHQDVSLLHLMQQHYDLVMLGDYHRHQYLSDKALYLGCPISHAYGDEGDQGVWLIDTALNVFQQQPFERGLFPQHRVWVIGDNPLSTALLDYRREDHNRITVPAGQREVYAQLYPTALVQTTGTVVLDTGNRRLHDLPDRTPVSIWRRVCMNKNLTLEVQQMGLEVLGEVASREWAV